MKKKNSIRYLISFTVLCLISAVVIAPAFITLAVSLFDPNEIVASYGGIYSGSGTIQLNLIPETASLESYETILLSTPNYLLKFWYSLFMTLSIVCGQLTISCVSGYGFAKFKFPFKNVIFYFLIILMLMPMQVTLVSNYIILDAMGLIGSYASIILPGIFSVFGIFLITQFFSTITDDILEAAKIDGANQMQILIKIVIPVRKSGLAALVILSFLDNWNMVEQPLVYLKDTKKYPLSIFLAQINESQLGLAFACGVLAMIPAVLLFFFLKDELIMGIENMNIK